MSDERASANPPGERRGQRCAPRAASGRALVARAIPLAYAVVVVLATSGCGSGKIPNTHVDNNEQNREVLEFVERYRRAVERRDLGALLSMTSRNYFDDMGTPAGDDDLDYERLKEALPEAIKEISAARYQISYRDVQYVENRVLVDILYTGWFRITTSTGPEWRRRLEPHRVVLAREGEEYKILSGL